MRTASKTIRKPTIGRRALWFVALFIVIVASGMSWMAVHRGLGDKAPGQKFARNAEAERLAFEGQQILAAKRAQDATGSKAKSLQDLQAHSKVPTGWAEGPDFAYVLHAKAATSACAAINLGAGLSINKRVVLSVKDAAKEQTANFGCLTADNTVFQKL